MKLVVQVKLLPDPEIASVLSATLAACNEAANLVSTIAHTHRDAQGKTPGNFDLRKLCYRQVRQIAPGSQAAQLVIKKVTDAYTTLRANLKAGTHGTTGSPRYERIANQQITFRPDAAQPFDARNLSWDLDRKTLSILTVAGRLKNIPFACSRKQLADLRAGTIKEPDLLTRDGMWFIHAVVETPDTLLSDPDGFLGVDLGVVNIATDSDGKRRAGRWVNHKRRAASEVEALG